MNDTAEKTTTPPAPCFWLFQQQVRVLQVEEPGAPPESEVEAGDGIWLEPAGQLSGEDFITLNVNVCHVVSLVEAAAHQ